MNRFVLTVTLGAAALQAEQINFDSAKVGGLPPGWSSPMTPAGGAPIWHVVPDATAPSKPNVLAQTSTDATGGRFPLAIYDNSNLQDGQVSVKFKTIAGKEDQAAGVVWRYRDPNTYYVARVNALEGNVVLYKVEGGQRVALAPNGAPPKAYGVEQKVPSGVWGTLRITFQGPVFTVYLNGDRLFAVDDTTFSQAGQVGLWTKADSVTYFDDFEFK
jgi:hypothetical protein